MDCINSGYVLFFNNKNFIGEELFLHHIVFDLHIHGIPLFHHNWDCLVTKKPQLFDLL